MRALAVRALALEVGGAHPELDQYDDLNKELLFDMPKLVADTEFFFEPLLAQLLVNQSKYFTALQVHAAQLASSPQCASTTC